MSTRTVELVAEWDSVPFDGGYEGLRTLSDQGFSGAVSAGPAQLFMLNGTVVGILDGDIEAFEDASGTARAAPHDALPLLAVMQDRADEPRAQYYTEDTSIAEVDRTLSDGNFTGFVELSENVLSGDYYLVYHQGRSMSVAWVGNSHRLVTDDDAFEQADGEVGIYQVMPADIEPVELPEPPEADAATEPSAAESASTAHSADTAATDYAETGADTDATDDSPGETGVSATATESDTGPAESTPESTPAESTSESPSSEPATRDTAGAEQRPAGPPGSKAAGSSQGSAADQRQRRESEPREPTERGESEPAAETESAERAGTRQASERAAARQERAETEPETEQRAETRAGETASPRAEAAASEGATQPAEPAERSEATPSVEADPESETLREDREAVSTATAQQRATEATEKTESIALETRSIPSLDPDRSQQASEAPTEQTASDTATQSTTETEPPATSATQPRAEPQPPADQHQQAVADLEAEVDEREREIGQLEAELSDLAAENEELAAERDELLTELEAARDEIERLESQLAAADTPASGGLQLSAAEAIDGTNLFVRYHSKGEATLAKARDGSADRAAVEENLRLEYHTQFDGSEAVVDGEEYETFLRDSIHYRFVEWLVRELLYEIRETGHQSAMDVLYDALPAVDRAELNGKVGVTYTEDGEQHRSQEQFDVVVRDRMGNPLVVANINDARQPATEGQMTTIVRNAERVGNASDSLAGAFLVTSSFFEPEALETAKEATSSGLFSRDKRKSFVNLSRKGGYHLCLLEARNREFHLAVPEL